jgi:hypothetical protein
MPAQARTLRSCYCFFRIMIDALRMVHGHAKDLTVPPPGSDELLLLARRMHFPEAAALQAELDERLRTTRALTSPLGQLLGLQ